MIADVVWHKSISVVVSLSSVEKKEMTAPQNLLAGGPCDGELSFAEDFDDEEEDEDEEDDQEDTDFLRLFVLRVFVKCRSYGRGRGVCIRVGLFEGDLSWPDNEGVVATVLSSTLSVEDTISNCEMS